MASTALPFYTQAAVLDQIIHSEHPKSDPVAIQVVLRVLRQRSDLRAYFFRHRPNPEWMSILWDQGFLNTPPNPVVTEHGEQWPFWDAQEYLISIASFVPQILIDHINVIEGSPVYVQRAVFGLKALPVACVKSVLPRLLDWLHDYSIASSMVDSVLEIIASALKDKEEDVAFSLFDALLTPFPNPHSKLIGTSVFNSEAVSSFEIYDGSDEEFRAIVSKLKELDAQRMVAITENHLLTALAIEAKTEGNIVIPSSWWRSSIESSTQNHHHNYKDDLLDILRDSCEYLFKSDNSSNQLLLERLLSNSDMLLRRLGIHLIRSFKEKFAEQVYTELTNCANYEDTEIHHEFMLLLREGYPILKASQQRRILDIILAGPPPERRKRFEEWAPECNDAERTEYIEKRCQGWILSLLWMLKAYLSGKEAEVLNQLTAKLGSLEHPEFLIWHSSGNFIRRDNSLSIDLTNEVSKLSPEELVSRLHDEKVVQPNEQAERNTFEDFVQATAELVVSSPTKYLNVFAQLLAVQPEYSSAILWQASRRASEGQISDVEWPIYLSACKQLLSNSQIVTSIEPIGEPGWRNVRYQMVNLLCYVFRNQQSRDIQISARDLLLTLINDPDPSLDQERSNAEETEPSPYFSHENHVRSLAISVLIQYAQNFAWQQSAGQKTFESNGLEEIVKAALNTKLQEHSRANHAVFGKHLLDLYRLDRQWVMDNLYAIFPYMEDSKHLELSLTAWNTFIATSNVTSTLYEELKYMYEWSIDNIDDRYADSRYRHVVEGLISHLIADYFENWSAKREQLDERRRTLLYRFFDKANPTYRTDAARGIRLRIQPSQTDKSAKASDWTAARLLWQDRLNQASSVGYPSDFDEEMKWLVALLEFAPPQENLITLWPLLTNTLNYLLDTLQSRQIWRAFEGYLVRQVEKDPIRSINLFGKMCIRIEHPNWVYNEANVRTILEHALRHSASRRGALSVIDHLGYKDDHRFRDLYDMYAA